MKEFRTKINRIIAYVCALALIITTITVTNSNVVKAAATGVANDLKYTVTDGESTIAGFTCQGIFDSARIHFAWGTAVDAESISVKVGEKTPEVYGKTSNGCHFLLSDIADLEIGEYNIEITATSLPQTVEGTTTEGKPVYGKAILKIEKYVKEDVASNPKDVKWDAVDWVGNGSGADATNKYKFYKVSDEVSLVNIQENEGDAGFYITNSFTAVNKVTVNGVETDKYKIQGAGTWLLLPAITTMYSTVVFTAGDREFTFYIYAPELPEESTGEAVSKDLKIEGFQINTNKFECDGKEFDGGLRTVYSVEPKINNQNVVEQGLVYGLLEDSNATEDQMVVGSDSQYVLSAAATDAGKMSVKFSESQTAQDFSMTMASQIKSTNVKGLQATYGVRAYAKLEDGTYVYGEISKFSFYNVANFLYQNLQMRTYDAHEYLYTNILKKVDTSYAAKEYGWGVTIVKPSDIK